MSFARRTEPTPAPSFVVACLVARTVRCPSEHTQTAVQPETKPKVQL